MSALKRLDDWQSKQRGRSVKLYKPSGYGVHDWELKLINVNIEPKEGWVETEINKLVHVGTVFAIDSKSSNPQYTEAENFVDGVEEGNLEELINKAIDRAEELGL